MCLSDGWLKLDRSGTLAAIHLLLHLIRLELRKESLGLLKEAVQGAFVVQNDSERVRELVVIAN
jgi:hypothetical protein